MAGGGKGCAAGRLVTTNKDMTAMPQDVLDAAMAVDAMDIAADEIGSFPEPAVSLVQAAQEALVPYEVPWNAICCCSTLCALS